MHLRDHGHGLNVLGHRELGAVVLLALVHVLGKVELVLEELEVDLLRASAEGLHLYADVLAQHGHVGEVVVGEAKGGVVGDRIGIDEQQPHANGDVLVAVVHLHDLPELAAVG